MFERFTTEARDTVTGAAAEARQAGSATVTEEHLLLALLSRGALDFLGVDRAAVAADLAAARRRGGMSRADEEALAGLGIDLSEIVSRVEEAHGEGALSPAAPGGGRGTSPSPRARRRSWNSPCGSPWAARTAASPPRTCYWHCSPAPARSPRS